jgi:hypothetical protein
MRFLLFLFVTLFVAVASAQDLNPDRFYYRGTVGTEPRQLELTINNQQLGGSTLHSGNLWRLEGNWAYEGPARMTEMSQEGEAGGLWMLKISSSEQGYANTLTGMYDRGQAAAFELQKVADYVHSQTSQSRIDVSITYPFFLNPVAFNDIIQKTALDEQQDFLIEGQQAEINQELFNGWSLESDYQIHYASETVLSLLNTRFSYTGGAHPNTTYAVMNYQITNDRLAALSLGDLFSEDTLPTLTTYITDDLEDQGAAWIVDESVAVDKDLLSLFTFSPLGFNFYFPPYVVAPYVQGPFEVHLSTETLESLSIKSMLASFIK